MNEDVEQAHNQEVHADLARFDAAAAATGAYGEPHATAITLGTTYPVRPGFVNPGPASGTVQMHALGPIVLSNATGQGELRDYLNGSKLAFPTKAFEYSPSYAEYGSPPTTMYENSLLVDSYPGGGELVNSQGQLVAGRTISLLVLSGEFAVGGTTDKELYIEPISAPPRSITITNTTAAEPVTVRLPTQLSNETWRSILADQYVHNGGYIERQQYTPATATASAVLTLQFTPGENYRLRMTHLRIADSKTAGNPEGPRYMTDTSGTSDTVDLGGSTALEVVVRDRFNNPLPNAVVRVTGPPMNGTVTTGSGGTVVRTDATGRATFRYTAPETYMAPNESITLSVDGVSGAAGEVTFDVRTRRPFEIRVENGTVYSTAEAARVTLLGTAITSGAGGSRIPVSVDVHVGDDPPFEPWPHNVNDDYMAAGNYRYFSVTNQENGTSISVTASASFTVSSNEELNSYPELVDVFLAGDRKPDYPGFGGQDDAEEFLSEYITDDGRIDIDDNEAIFLFELGTTNTGSSAADYQDAVVLVTFLEDEEDGT